MVALKASREIHKSTAVSTNNTDSVHTVEPKGKKAVLGYSNTPTETSPSPVVSIFTKPMMMYVQIMISMHDASRIWVPNRYNPVLRSDHSLQQGSRDV